VLVAVVGIAAVLVAGGLFASNMGFKLNYTLSGTGSSASGTNTLGLPFFRQVGVDDAKQLIDDIEQGDSTRVTNVQRWNVASDTLTVYTGTAGTAFALSAGEGYFVKAGTSNVSYIVVGSHDPGFTVNLKGTGSSASGTNFYAYPYHSTAADAKQLIDDIEQGDTTVVTNIQRWNAASDTLTVYTGTAGTAFALVPGEAYFVKIGVNDVNYVPSHY
jgi:hypothetical protein